MKGIRVFRKGFSLLALAFLLAGGAGDVALRPTPAEAWFPKIKLIIPGHWNEKTLSCDAFVTPYDCLILVLRDGGNKVVRVPFR